MTIEKVLITGSKGVIGRVLREGLRYSFQITQADLPEVDLTDRAQTYQALRGQEAVIHLAWNKRRVINGAGILVDDAGREEIDPMNLEMALNVYRACRELKVRRVIMASSGQADRFQDWKGPELMDPYTLPNPRWPYGASKVWIEAVGRSFASYYDLEVICVRFGAVRRNNLPPKGEEHVFLSHEDCIGAITASLKAKTIPNNYTIFYAVSNNPGRIHDFSNPLGWKPENS